MIKKISLFQENVAILSVVYYQQKVFKSVASFVKCCSWFPENNSPNIEVRLRSAVAAVTAVAAVITWSNLDRQGLGLAASKMHPKFGPKMHSPFFASFACKVNTYPAQCCTNGHKACQWSNSCNCKSKHWVCNVTKMLFHQFHQKGMDRNIFNPAKQSFYISAS